ncbi:AMP-binding protein [Roseomonas sp. OT10]|uniref:AMP-binding protein n=1 Tax=Roseomonas cutis TaxID=2897332 RepID=UPI001E5D388B|nr:AMP-binding protein [Roseomonas sp. OT10]UFN48247.1 AMP-binding protein [Roseomonas sp. OT10]
MIETAPTGTAPLTIRGPEEILFRRGAAPVTVGAFLADVAALAARLPDRAEVLNLCGDRYLALVGFAAALSRGQVTLLSADRSERRQRELAARFPGAYALTDGLLPDGASPATSPEVGGGGPLPMVVVAATDAPGGPAPNPAIPLDRIAVIGFTSGSTGEPAAHPKSWHALVAAAGAAAARFGLERGHPGGEATLVATVPPQHMYGFETTLVLPLHAGTASHAGPHFYPVEVAEALAAAPGRRVLVTTPLQMRALLGSGAALPPVEAVISATAPLSPALADSAEQAWGTRVLEIYGATEVGSIASRRTVGGEEWRPYRGVVLHPAGEDAVEAEVPGMPARVPLADAMSLRPDGCFRLLGRRSDVVKLGGKRASLAGLNRLLAEVEGVQDGVFVAPEDLDRNPSARLAAYVVAPGRTPADILAALRPQLEPVFLPRPVVMLDALPRDPVGKLTRRALALLRQGTADPG